MTKLPVPLLCLGICLGASMAPDLSGVPSIVPAAVASMNDSDGDRVVDTVDVDDDNDGIADIDEISPTGADIDSDGDGMPNRLDLDSDNDGILDWQESGAVITTDFSVLRILAGRIVGDVGRNGMIDKLENPVDSSNAAYTLANSDAPFDDIPDVLDLDSDNDGLPDLLEIGVAPELDSDGDGRIDAPPGTVGNDGIADRLQSVNDKSCCDINGDGIDDVIPRNSDSSDLPDYLDLDSDNDSVSDLVEAGGTDIDKNGRVDNFFDSPLADGMDDALLLVPLTPGDANGNGVSDQADQFVQVPAVPVTEPTPTTPAEPVDSGEPARPQDDPANPGTAPQDDPVHNSSTINSPTPANDDVLADDVGVVRTGLDASGCSIQSASMDVLLILLSVVSIAVLGWRYTMRRVR